MSTKDLAKEIRGLVSDLIAYEDVDDIDADLRMEVMDDLGQRFKMSSDPEWEDNFLDAWDMAINH